MNKFWGKNYLFVVSVLALIAVGVIFSLINIDKILEKSSFSKTQLVQKINSIIKFQNSSKDPIEHQIQFKDTILWKSILNDYVNKNFENKYPQSLFRPGTIKHIDPNKSITFVSPDNKEHTMYTNDMTSFYLPKDYYVDGSEKMSYKPVQISQTTAYAYYLKVGSTIFVEAFSANAFKDGENYSGNYSILIVER